MNIGVYSVHIFHSSPSMLLYAHCLKHFAYVAMHLFLVTTEMTSQWFSCYVMVPCEFFRGGLGVGAQTSGPQSYSYFLSYLEYLLFKIF